MEHMGTVMNIVERVRNFEDIDEKMKKLKRKCDHLKSREEDVEAELKFAEGISLKKPRKVVENWLANVASIKNEVEQMEQQVRESSRLSSYWQLDPKIARLTEEVTELDQQGQFPDGLSLNTHGIQGIELITTKLISQTFLRHKDAIWKWLRSDNVSKIGIYGMGGVGKTTLVTHIYNELIAHQDFSVSWVTVSQNFSIRELQSDIAKTLELQIENDDDERKRAAKLAQRLRNMRSFVLILDDVWQHFEPYHEVGIPTGRNGCKLILTSQSLQVCQRIGCQETIKVERLSEEEAWELFTDRLGDGRALPPEIKPIARSLTKKCYNLPLAIVIMAGCMKGVEDMAEWRYALEKLKDQQVHFPDGFTLEAHGIQEIELITTKLIGQTFRRHKDAIWKWLRSDNVSKIGIYGMGGVGKTTLVTHIHNELLAHQDFSVSWVTVSQNFSTRKLQSDIAKILELQIENDDDERKRAAKLAQRLRNMNSFVLILDDVWQHFEPYHEVGIPTGRNGCKLILTSRSLEVCQRIGCQETIKVEQLSEEEAWELFTDKLEQLSPEIEPIARSLTKKCYNLPLAIVTMARSMKGVEDIAEWRDALEKLKESVAEHHDDRIFVVLKHSYDQLKDPKVQRCLLYCSLYPEDYQIDRETLVEHFIDERFVDGLRNRQAELDMGHTILNKLEKVCLLEGGISNSDGRKYVKMHGLVRSMAIRIGRDNFQYSVETVEETEKIDTKGRRAGKGSYKGFFDGGKTYH